MAETSGHCSIILEIDHSAGTMNVACKCLHVRQRGRLSFNARSDSEITTFLGKQTNWAFKYSALPLFNAVHPCWGQKIITRKTQRCFTNNLNKSALLDLNSKIQVAVKRNNLTRPLCPENCHVAILCAQAVRAAYDNLVRLLVRASRALADVGEQAHAGLVEGTHNPSRPLERVLLSNVHCLVASMSLPTGPFFLGVWGSRLSAGQNKRSALGRSILTRGRCRWRGRTSWMTS